MSLTIKIDLKSKEGKLLAEYVKSLAYVTVQEDDIRYNEKTEKAIKEAREGKGIIKTKRHADLMNKLRE